MSSAPDACGRAAGECKRGQRSGRIERDEETLPGIKHARLSGYSGFRCAPRPGKRLRGYRHRLGTLDLRDDIDVVPKIVFRNEFDYLLGVGCLGQNVPSVAGEVR